MIFGFLGQNDFSLLLRLAVAHLIADFLVQTKHKRRLQPKKRWTSGRRLWVHGAVAGLLVYAFAACWNAVWLPFAILIAHALLDGLGREPEQTASYFLLNQLGHFIVILGCWTLLANADLSDIASFLIWTASNVKLWILAFSYIAVIWPMGIWVGKVTAPWRKEIDPASCQGLEKAGLWIGRLERILILTFVLLKHFEAIGFLIAAKSILRFGEIRSPDSRKHAEYVLIGTMTSLAVAIALGIFTSWILKYVSMM